MLKAAQQNGTNLYEVPSGTSYLLDQDFLSALGDVIRDFDDTEQNAFLAQIPDSSSVLKDGLTNIVYSSSEALEETYDQFMAEFSEQQTFFTDSNQDRLLIIGPPEVWENTSQSFQTELLQNGNLRTVNATWNFIGQGARLADGLL